MPPTYWDLDQSAPIPCPRCGHTGVPDIGDTEAFLDVRCAACDGPITKISWPTTDETRAAAAAGNLRAIEALPSAERSAARRERAARLELADPSQLPPIADERIEITWDQVERDDEEWTVLRHGDRELFRELAYWEGVDRFEEVAEILRRAYGPRLRAVVPTRGSEMYLYGDRLGAPRTVEALNDELGRGAG